MNSTHRSLALGLAKSSPTSSSKHKNGLAIEYLKASHNRKNTLGVACTIGLAHLTLMDTLAIKQGSTQSLRKLQNEFTFVLCAEEAKILKDLKSPPSKWLSWANIHSAPLVHQCTASAAFVIQTLTLASQNASQK